MANPKLTIEFNDRPFQRSHGRAPRGYGSWAFKLRGQSDDQAVFAPSMTFTNARRWYRDYVRSIAPVDFAGPAYAEVLP